MLVKLVVNLKTADEADVARVFSENGISYVRKDSFVKEDDFDDGVHTVEYSVRRANFHRAHALLLKEFKDNPEVLKAIVPRTSADS